MIRGTNVQFKFNLPCSFSTLQVVKITFWQNHNDGPSKDRPLPIIKILEQCSVGDNPNQLTVRLNQEETLRFSEKRKAHVQLRAATYDGVPIASKDHLVTVYPVYDDSILDGDIVPTPTPDIDGWVYLDGSVII